MVQVDLDQNAIMCDGATKPRVATHQDHPPPALLTAPHHFPPRRCDGDIAAKMHLPQRQYHKLYKAVAPFCRRLNTDDGMSSEVASAFPMAPPPDDDAGAADATSLVEMSDEAVKEAISKIKAAFLRFFVSMMADYQKVMIVPQYSAELKLPSALDFFDLKKWISRFSLEKVEKGSKDFKVDWVEMFAQGQAFTQWLEQRLAPADKPELEVVFFNESIDAKQMRSAKTQLKAQLFAKQATPLLSTGTMHPLGYRGTERRRPPPDRPRRHPHLAHSPPLTHASPDPHPFAGELVPSASRTVYNASMIAARPQQKQQKLALLLVLGSGIAEGGGGSERGSDGDDAPAVAAFTAAIKQEFARHLLWSRVDVGAAILCRACKWVSRGAAFHRQFAPSTATTPLPSGRSSAAASTAGPGAGSAGLENLPVRAVTMDAALYNTNKDYKDELFAALRASLAELARDGGGDAPLCVIGHGFGAALAVEYFEALQQKSKALRGGADGSLLERGHTLATLATLGCPLPLLAGAGAAPPPATPAMASLPAPIPTGGGGGGGGSRRNSRDERRNSKKSSFASSRSTWARRRRHRRRPSRRRRRRAGSWSRPTPPPTSPPPSPRSAPRRRRRRRRRAGWRCRRPRCWCAAPTSAAAGPTSTTRPT